MKVKKKKTLYIYNRKNKNEVFFFVYYEKLKNFFLIIFNYKILL